MCFPVPNHADPILKTCPIYKFVAYTLSYFFSDKMFNLKNSSSLKSDTLSPIFLTNDIRQATITSDIKYVYVKEVLQNKTLIKFGSAT